MLFRLFCVLFNSENRGNLGLFYASRYLIMDIMRYWNSAAIAIMEGTIYSK